jgi:hypothetical protein
MATARNNLYMNYALAQTISSDPVANQIFQTLLESSSLSGWALAKATNASPEEVNRALGILVSHGVIGSQGTGLEAFYYVTAQGYQLRSSALA